MAAPLTFAQLRAVQDRPTNKLKLYNDLISVGYTQATSWEDGTPPSALVEVEALGLTEFQQARVEILNSGFNEWAEGEALAEHSRQVYDNEPLPGRRARGLLRLTDTGAGPFNGNDPGAMSFSAGEGGLIFHGLPGAKFDLPLNGSAYLLVEAEAEGGDYNVAAGTLNTFVRGVLPGVEVTNEAGWQQALGAQVGASGESEKALRARNRDKWKTLGKGSPPGAYRAWAAAADVSITRVETFTNLDLLDPGCITVLVAGDAGGLPGQVIKAAQDAISPAQVGGENIPETARAVVASAVNNVLAVSGILYVQAEYNSVSFQQLVYANVLTFQKALKIGQRVSAERLLQVATNVAGLDPDVITDVSDFSPSADAVQRYWQVAVFDLSGLQFVSV